MIERLEDLATYEQAFLSALPQDGTTARRALWPDRLRETGLIKVDLREDANYINVTDKYTEMVVAFGVRQSASEPTLMEQLEAKSIADNHYALLAQRENSILQAQVAALQAENKRLQSELYAFYSAVQPTFTIINRPAVRANLQGEQLSAFWLLSDAMERMKDFFASKETQS